MTLGFVGEVSSALLGFLLLHIVLQGKLYIVFWQKIKKKLQFTLYSAKFAQVILGAHDLYSPINQPNYITMKVDKFYDHPDYEPTQIVNDVALIQLPQAVQYTGK